MEGSAAKGKARMFNGQRKNSNAHAAHPVVKDELSESGAESDASVDETVYRSRPELPKPHVHMRSLESLIKDLDSARIDIDPEYQRDVVWTADRMTGLINSLMENYYIPPIILNKKTNSAVNGETSRDTLVCVDGKQRLSSVRAFVKGMIPCHDHRGEKWWFCNAPGTRRRRLLPPATKRLFLNKDFVTFQFSRLTPDQEEDLFSRVQMGIQLSPAEKMRARSGPWQELAKLFVEDFPAIYDLLKDRTRAKDFQVTLACFAQLLEVMQSTPTNKEPRFRAKQAALLKLINDKAPIDDATKSHLASIWTTFSELVALDSDVFTNSSNYIRNGDSFPLLEMVGVTVLIWKHSETRSHELLLGDIKALRKALREYFSDLRAGEPSWKFVWEFILDLEAIRGPGDDTAATQTPQRQPSTSTVSSLEPVSGAQPVQHPPPVQSPQPAPALPAISKKRVAPETTSEGIFSQHSSDIIQNRTLLDALSRKRQRNYSRPPSLTVAHNDFLRDSSTDFKRSDQSDTPQRPSVGNEPVTTPFSTSCFLSKSFLSHFTRAVPSSQPDRAVGKGRTQDPTRETSIPPKTTTPNLNIAGRVHDCYSRADARSPRTEDQVNISTYRTPAPTPPSTSSSPQLQQSKFLEIKNQGHKTATLSDSTQLPSPSTCSVTNTRGNVTPASPLETSPVYPKGQGPFAVRHTEQDMEGFIVPASPQTSFQFRPLTPTTVQSARSPFICSDIKTRKPVCRPTREQIEGAIDLTGDT